MTFGLLYAFSEHFVLPLSHDEVVHGKGSLIGKMPGDRWQKIRQPARLFRLHVGPSRQEAAVHGRRDRARSASGTTTRSSTGTCSSDPLHRGMQRLVRDLNRVYRSGRPALHALDCRQTGFRWIIGDDRANSVFAFYRSGYEGAPPVLVVCNMTPGAAHRTISIGVPAPGAGARSSTPMRESTVASNMGNGGYVQRIDRRSHGQPLSIELTLPPLSTLLLRSEND